MQAVKEELEYTYENGTQESYLIIKAPEEGRVIRYQAEMAACNAIPGVVPFQVRRRDETVCFYYIITSRLALAQFLSRTKLTRDEFVTVLCNIVRVLLDSGSYLLHKNQFILEPELIFIHPATLEVSLVYLPVAGERDPEAYFRQFVTELILHSADIAEEDGDNFIQRIIGALKSEGFSLPAFQKLLYALKDREPQEVQQPGTAETVSAAAPMERPSNPRYLIPFMGIVISNAAVLLLMWLNRGLFLSMGNDLVTTFGALALILAAMDALLMKKWKERSAKQGDAVREAASPGFPVQVPKKEWSLTGQLEQSYRAAMETYEPVVEETTLLQAAKEKFPYLQSKQDGVLERISIYKSQFTFGRLKEQVDYLSQNKAVGKVHAEFILRDGAVLLKDLNSRNGTFINDIKIDSNKEYEVKNNDKISFANQEYIFVQPGI